MVGLNLHFGSLIQCFKNSMGNTFEKPFIALSFIQHLFGSRYRHQQFPQRSHPPTTWQIIGIDVIDEGVAVEGPGVLFEGGEGVVFSGFHAAAQPKYMFISKKHHRIIRFQTASSIFRRESITAKTTIRSVSLR